jgi:hypothetical protein
MGLKVNNNNLTKMPDVHKLIFTFICRKFTKLQNDHLGGRSILYNLNAHIKVLAFRHEMF